MHWTTAGEISFEESLYTELKGKCRRRFVTHIGPPLELMEFLEQHFKNLSVHLFVVRHQAASMEELYQKLPRTHIISRWDLAQNYHHRRAVQSQHEYFDPDQTTIVTCITHFHDGRKLVCEEMHFLTPDLIHDSALVQHCVAVPACHYIEKLPFKIDRHHVFAPQHFKVCHTINFLSDYEISYNIPLSWGVCQGPNDPAGAFIKTEGDRARTLEHYRESNY